MNCGYEDSNFGHVMVGVLSSLGCRICLDNKNSVGFLGLMVALFTPQNSINSCRLWSNQAPENRHCALFLMPKMLCFCMFSGPYLCCNMMIIVYQSHMQPGFICLLF